MELKEMLKLVQELSDQELDQLAYAAEWELKERACRKEEQIQTLGLIPVYQCQEPEHQAWGLYAEDPDQPGILVCGCPKKSAQFAGYE